MRWTLGACGRPENLTWVSCVLVQPPNDEITLLLLLVAFLNLPVRVSVRAHQGLVGSLPRTCTHKENCLWVSQKVSGETQIESKEADSRTNEHVVVVVAAAPL